MAAKLLHPWSKEALLAKAQLYAQEMRRYSHNDWQFGRESTFVLEFVARAALSNVSPVLIAKEEWNNLYYGLGHTPKSTTFAPKSKITSDVLNHAAEIITGFTDDLRRFSIEHMNRRNEELHTGATPFYGLTTDWQAHFYEALTVLLSSMGLKLEYLVGSAETKHATELIAASKVKSEKDVRDAVIAHTRMWDSKSDAEKRTLSYQASIRASRAVGHRVVCPACRSDALVMGSPISDPIRILDGDIIVTTQERQPTKFECTACGLKMLGISQLNVFALGATYKSTVSFDAAELYSPEDEHSVFEDYNNE